MPKPERRTALTRAPRAAGTYAINTAPASTAATAPQIPTPAPVEEETALRVVDTPTITPAKVRKVEPLVEVSFTEKDLLDTPVRITNTVLDDDLDRTLRATRVSLRKQGYRVTLGTLISHALASAYAHHEQWLSTVEPDARRHRDTPSAAANKRRTSLNLPAGLEAAAEFLVWKLSERDDAVIPSMASVQIAALRWGLAHQETWMPAVVTN